MFYLFWIFPKIALSGEVVISRSQRLLVSEGSWHENQIDKINFLSQCAIGSSNTKGTCERKVFSMSEEELGDLAGLRAFYDSLGGATWKYNFGWLKGSPCWDLWFGIDCNGDGRVVKISLPDNRLKGIIPVEISMLTALKSLHLQTSTQTIFMYKNPDANKITGTVPSLAALTNLQVLDLSGNFINALPVDLGKNINLEILSCSWNFLTFLPNISTLLKLKIFQMQSNPIIDIFPHSICNLNSLMIIDLGNTTLSGNLPACIATELNPTVFDVSAPHPTGLGPGKGLTGGFPDDLVISNWTHLQYLSVYGQISMTGRIAGECISTRICFRNMFAAHSDLSWASSTSDVPSFVFDNVALATTG